MQLGPLSLPLWLILVVLAVIRLLLNLNQTKKKGDIQMKLKTSMLVLFPLTAVAEVAWDVGAKVAAAKQRS